VFFEAHIDVYADDGYQVEDVLADGQSAEAADTHTFAADHAIRATFAPEIIFDGSVSGIRLDPVPTGDNPFFNGVGTSYFEWGEPADYNSNLRFKGSSFDMAPEEPFNLGTVTYYNRTAEAGTDASSVTLMLTLDIQHPAEISLETAFPLELVNVPSQGTALENADFVYFRILFRSSLLH